MKELLLRILFVISTLLFVPVIALVVILAVPIWIITGRNVFDQGIIEDYFVWCTSVLKI